MKEAINQTEHISDIFARVMARILTPSVCPDEITMAQFQAMRHISHQGASTIGHLAEGLFVSQPAATMLVDRMLKKGLVERHPARKDRRQAEVTLTPHGEQLLERIDQERAERFEKIFSAMDPSECRRFVESMEKFIESALKLECLPGEVCMRCGDQHKDDCIVRQTQNAVEKIKCQGETK